MNRKLFERHRPRILALVSFLALTLSPRAQSLTENQLSDIQFEQKLNSQISLDLPFRNEAGKNIRLRDLFGKKPVVLVLGYYKCPMLCALTLNGMVECMEEMKWTIGDQFSVLNVSIDPLEMPPLAAAKKQAYLRRYGRALGSEGWHFLTGDKPAIQALANEVGFRYAYDPSIKQYAHPSGLVILTPEGKVAKYLFGVTFSAKDLYTALAGASQEKIGSPIDRLILLCFHYSPIHGKYGPLIMMVIRILGGATLLGLAYLFAAMIRAETKRRDSLPIPVPRESSS